MHRRAVLASSAAILLAGCSQVSDVLGDGYVDETLRDEKTAQFSAEADEELSVTVTGIDVAEAEEGAVQSDSISFRLDHADEGPFVTRSISEPETFDVTIETAGTHIAIVTNGSADVTIEPAE